MKMPHLTVAGDGSIALEITGYKSFKVASLRVETQVLRTVRENWCD